MKNKTVAFVRFFFQRFFLCTLNSEHILYIYNIPIYLYFLLSYFVFSNIVFVFLFCFIVFKKYTSAATKRTHDSFVFFFCFCLHLFIYCTTLPFSSLLLVLGKLVVVRFFPFSPQFVLLLVSQHYVYKYLVA